MRRKLINWETFERIQKDSLSTAERELAEASDVLARTLDLDHLDLNCFGESNVVYETLDGDYVRADYSISNGFITLENIETLVIDRETAERAGISKLTEMVEAILSKEGLKAEQIFSDYITMPEVRRSFMEAGRPEGFIRPSDEAKKAGKSKSKNARTHSSIFKRRKSVLDSHSSPNAHRSRRKRGAFGSAKHDANYQSRYWKQTQKNKTRRKVLDKEGNFSIRKNMREWFNLCENVFGFVDYHEFGPAIKESMVRRDDHGNISAIRIPVTHVRNEGKVLTLSYKTMMDQEWKVIREQATHLVHDQGFCKVVAELKRYNNLSDNNGLQTTLENIISRYPSVLYLTQSELSKTIGEALNSLGVKNYDDQVCNFMAEGILRTAHDVYSDRVNKILKLAHADAGNGDPYVGFQNVVEKFYPAMDESYQRETQMFADLCDAFHEVYNIAARTGDENTKYEAGKILEALIPVARGEDRIDLDLAADAAEWLGRFLEHELEGGEWNVSNDAYLTKAGEHPAMAEKARQSYAPAAGFDAGAKAWQKQSTEPAFDGQMWTAVGGEEVFPGLHNPYVPKPFGDFTIKGEDGVDKHGNDATGQWQSGDTWPELDNPYVPKSDNKVFRMKDGSETDLIVDR